MSVVAPVSVAAAAARSPGHLLRVLGVAFGVAAIVGNTIGAGILRTPGEVAALLPSPALFLAVWIAGGVYALLGVVSLAELGVLIPRSGGQYVFVHRAFGPYAGFVIGWSDWISTAASVSAVAIVFGEYSGQLIPRLAGSTTMVALLAILFFVVLQARGIRWGDRTQQLTTFLKALAFIALIAACFIAGRRLAPAPAPVPDTSLAVGLILSMQAVIYTFDGWNGMLYFSEEVRDPARDIPRGMFGGVIGVIAIYLLLNAAMLYVLGIAGMAGRSFPAADAARVVFGAWGDTAIRVLMLVSLASAINAIILMSSRVPYAMSQDGLFASAASRVNRGGTPIVTLVASAALSAVLILTGTFNTAIAIAAFFFVLNYVGSFASVFVLRRREPDAPRPYRAWGYPVTTAVSLIGGIAFLVAAVIGDTRNSLHALAMLVLSYPAYRLTVRR
jgi:APA family basic amino acid/polyamine antiporter